MPKCDANLIKNLAYVKEAGFALLRSGSINAEPHEGVFLAIGCVGTAVVNARKHVLPKRMFTGALAKWAPMSMLGRYERDAGSDAVSNHQKAYSSFRVYQSIGTLRQMF